MLPVLPSEGPPYAGFYPRFRIRPVMPSSHPSSTMRTAKRIWPHRQRARPSAGFFRSSDMLFTKCSHYGAQIERTKGFDPIQRARHARAFCCQPFLRLSSPLSRMESKRCPTLNTLSLMQFGDQAHQHYQALILAALQAIAGIPYRIGSHDHDELAPAFAAITSFTHAQLRPEVLGPTGLSRRTTRNTMFNFACHFQC